MASGPSRCIEVYALKTSAFLDFQFRTAFSASTLRLQSRTLFDGGNYLP